MKDGFHAAVVQRRSAFVDDLASCRRVLATGGHPLISEAIHRGDAFGETVPTRTRGELRES